MKISDDTRQKIFESIIGHKMQYIPLDFKNHTYLRCAPIDAFPNVPEDYEKPATIEKCSWCNKEMWVGKKTQGAFKKINNAVKICFHCFYWTAKHQGIDLRNHHESFL